VSRGCASSASRLDRWYHFPGFWADREALQPGGVAPLLMWAVLRGPDGGTLPVKLLQVCLSGDARTKTVEMHSVRSLCLQYFISRKKAFLRHMMLCVHAERRVDSGVHGL
jgi:hypothetical protein